MKKGKKRLLLGWICLLLSLCMVTAASAETDGTPIQPCHQVTMTEQKTHRAKRRVHQRAAHHNRAGHGGCRAERAGG